MKKSTALEILRRYDGYSIATVGRPDICDAIVGANGRPFYDTVNLVYLWSLDREEMPYEGPASLEYPVREHFALETFVDYLEEKREGMDRSPWSGKGALGGSCNGMVRLLPFDLDRAAHRLDQGFEAQNGRFQPQVGGRVLQPPHQRGQIGGGEILEHGKADGQGRGLGPRHQMGETVKLGLRRIQPALAECRRHDPPAGAAMEQRLAQMRLELG